MDAETVALGGLSIVVSCYAFLESGFSTARAPLSTVALGPAIGSLLSEVVRT